MTQKDFFRCELLWDWGREVKEKKHEHLLMWLGKLCSSSLLTVTTSLVYCLWAPWRPVVAPRFHSGERFGYIFWQMLPWWLSPACGPLSTPPTPPPPPLHQSWDNYGSQFHTFLRANSQVCRHGRTFSPLLWRRRPPLHLDVALLMPSPVSSLFPHSQSTQGISASLLLKKVIKPGNKMSVYFSFQVIYLSSQPSHTWLEIAIDSISTLQKAFFLSQQPLGGMGGWASSLTMGLSVSPAGRWLTPTAGDCINLEYGTHCVFRLQFEF